MEPPLELGAGEKGEPLRAGLEVRLSGELEIRRDGQRTELPASKKTRALLGYLVATGRAHLREQICDLLWNGPDDPRASLRWSLAKLRPLVDFPDRPALIADRTHVGWAPAAGRVDVLAARAGLRDGAARATVEELREATTHLRGELLEGLDLPDCYRYHEWLVGERESLRRLRVELLDALAERLRPTDPEEALRHARTWVAIDPLSESAHAAVTKLLGALGRRSEAMAQIETCKRILAYELGAKPTWVLERARLDLASATPREAPPESPRDAGALARGAVCTAQSTAIAGRRNERTEISAQVAAASAGGSGRVLFLTGEPGIGKSRLLEEVAAMVRSVGGVVMTGRCFEVERVRPYGAWIDALRSVPRELLETAASDLGLLLPDLLGGERAESATVGRLGSSEANRASLYTAIVRLLGRLAASTPAALVVDDVQWLDEASTSLFHFATRELASSRVVFACAARAGELADNRTAQRMLRTLKREGRLAEIELGPLDAEAVRELCVRAGAHQLDAVVAQSGGNPLYALELARSPTPASGFPPTLAAIFEERFERLEARSRDLLPWAAAFGRGFAVERLGAAAGCTGADLLGALAELEQRGIVRPTGAGSTGAGYDFVHDLIRQAAFESLGEAKRRFIHGRIAEMLAASPDPEGGSSGELAHHAALAGDAATAARACLAAAERCLWLYAREEALAFALRGMALVDRLAGTERVACAVGLLRVRVLATPRSKRPPELTATLGRAAADAADAGLLEDATKAFYALSVARHEGGEFASAGATSLRTAEIARASTPAVAALHIANSACCLLELERDVPHARELLVEARALAEANGVEAPDVWLGLALFRLHEGDVGGARPLIERASAIAEKQGDSWRRFWTLRRLVMLDLQTNDFDRAIERAEAMGELARNLGDGSEAATASALKGAARFAKGEEGGLEALEAGLDRLREVDSKKMLAHVLSFAAEVELARGDPRSARGRADGALAAAKALGIKNLEAVALVALGSAALLEGDRRRAQEHAEAAIASDRRGPEILSASTLARIVALERAIKTPDATVVSTGAQTPASTQKPQARRRR